MNRISILDPIEKLKKINPWKINIAKELEVLLEILREKINFFIAGIATENSSIIYREKIERIFSLTEEKKETIKLPLSTPKIRKLEIAVVPERSLIDISSILPVIQQIIERRLSMPAKVEEEFEIPVFEDYSRLIEEVRQRIGGIIKRFLSLYRKPISIKDIFETLSGYSFAVIFLVLLFMYMDGEIDIDVIEEAGETVDVQIKLPI